jgi:hypothetical protein
MERAQQIWRTDGGGEAAKPLAAAEDYSNRPHALARVHLVAKLGWSKDPRLRARIITASRTAEPEVVRTTMRPSVAYAPMPSKNHVDVSEFVLAEVRCHLGN